MTEKRIQQTLFRLAAAGLLGALLSFSVPGAYGLRADTPFDLAPEGFLQNEVAFGPAARLDATLSISKSANVEYVAAGGYITYSIGIQHAPASGTSAADVIITDVLPPEVDIVSGPMCSLGSQAADGGCAYDSSTRTISARWTSFSLSGGAGQIRFVVRANASLRCGRDLANVAAVRWSTLPGGPRSAAWSVSMIHPSLRAGSEVCPTELPGTSLRPRQLRPLGTPPAIRTAAYDGMSLDIARLGISQMSIVEVPLVAGSWDISGLGDNAGWLETTAAPGQRGNSVLTAHVTDIYGWPGPFAQLSTLAIGDQIVVRGAGQASTYVVQSIVDVAPNDLSVLNDTGETMLTLLTCSRPNYSTQTYDGRLAVHAALVQQTSEQ